MHCVLTSLPQPPFGSARFSYCFFVLFCVCCACFFVLPFVVVLCCCVFVLGVVCVFVLFVVVVVGLCLFWFVVVVVVVVVF